MSGKMKTELYERLRHYNRWRRGDEEIPQPDPKELGELIDSAADRLEVLELENKDFFERWHDERRKIEEIESKIKDMAANPDHGLAENCKLRASLRECFYLSRKLMESAACALDRPDPWMDIKDGLPDSGVPVLLSCGDGEVIRAIYAAKHTLSTSNFGLVDDGDTVDYSEDHDELYIPSGWYEFNYHERGHWHIQSEAKCWMPLPLPSFNKNL